MKTKAETMKKLGWVLRHNITIEKQTATTGPSGDPVTEWVPVCTTRGKRESLYGRDYFAAVAVGEQETVEFIIRQNPALVTITTDNHRLVHDGIVYDIRQVDYLDDDGMWLKIRGLRHG